MSPERARAALITPDATELLHAVALPLLQLDAQRRLVWLNAAAERALAAQHGDDWPVLWTDAAAAQALCGPDRGQATLRAARADHGAGSFAAQSAPLAGGGWLLTLAPGEARPPVQADALSLALSVGGIAVWRHEIGRAHV